MPMQGAARLSSMLLAVSLAGCMVARDYKRPPIEVPENFRFYNAKAKPVAPARWWEQFGDPALTAAIRTALERNLDMRIATAALLEFQAIYVGTGAAALPQVSVTASGSRAEAGQVITETYQGALNLGWEIDFWGRIRHLSKAAYADLLGREQARRAVVLTLVSSVARSYIELRELDRRLEIAQRTLESRRESQRLAALQYKAGLISELELKQVESEYQGTVSIVQQLEQLEAQKENELSILMGRNSGPIQRGRSLEAIALPAVPAGLPSELLERRPDLLQAEQDLIAANARVDAARASLFPTISLTAAYGVASLELSKLFSGPSRAWSFGPSIAVPIFSGGRLSAQVDAAEARREQAVARYQKAVQSAFRETEDALVAVTKIFAQKDAQAAQVGTLRRYAYLAKLRYDNGVTSSLEVLDSQRGLLTAELGLAQLQSAELLAIVNLYRVLGGDWGVDGAPVAKESRSSGSLLFRR